MGSLPEPDKNTNLQAGFWANLFGKADKDLSSVGVSRGAESESKKAEPDGRQELVVDLMASVF